MTYPSNDSLYDVTDEQWLEYLSEIEAAAKEVAHATGKKNALKKQILEDTNFEKGALSIVEAMDKKADTVLADRLRSLEFLLPMMKRLIWDDRIRDMLDREDEKTRAMEADIAAE